MFLSAMFLMIAALAAPVPAAADKQVRSVDVYVTPYYSAAGDARQRKVNVGKAYDALLRSDDRADIIKARDAALADAGNVSPLVMMVLSARLYDIGERDEAVFWHYAAKDRFTTVIDVLAGYDRGGMGSAGAELRSAMISFVQLAGPTINSYAFCAVANQQRQRKRAFEWVKANPYRPLFDKGQKAKGADRQALLDASIASLKESMDQESAYLAEPDTAEMMKKRRAENNVDAQYCW